MERRGACKRTKILPLSSPPAEQSQSRVCFVTVRRSRNWNNGHVVTYGQRTQSWRFSETIVVTGNQKKVSPTTIKSTRHSSLLREICWQRLLQWCAGADLSYQPTARAGRSDL